MAELLAYNSRLGVFAENEKLLKNSTEGFLRQNEVTALAIFTSGGKLLIRREKEGRDIKRKSIKADLGKLKHILAEIRKQRSSWHVEDTAGTMEVWVPVVSSTSYFVEEASLFGKNVSRADPIMGLAVIMLDKQILDKQIHALVIEGILIGVIFLVIGFVGIFTLAKRITRPLNKLTQEVKALSRGVAVEEVPVETTDEVGRLALAFNTMVIKLKQAEEKLISSREQLRSLAARLAEMEETEKKRLTQIIHDEILQDLTTISINLKVVRSQLPKEIEDLIGLHIDDSESLLEQTIDYLRNVIADLRPSVLDDIGLLATLRWYGKQFSERTGVNLKAQGEEMMPRLPLATEIALFRISQEALNNIAKHAQATQVTVTLKEEAGMAQLHIADDGIGFVNSDIRIREQTGWGLMTMKERATAVGWRLRVESELGKGTQIVVEGKR